MAEKLKSRWQKNSEDQKRIKTFMQTDLQSRHSDHTLFGKFAKLYTKKTRQDLRTGQFSRVVSVVELENVLRLLRAGVAVEIPLDHKISSRSRVRFNNMGPSLDYLLSNPLTKFLFRKRLKELILKEMPKHIAMMHAQGIRHNHLHFRNITIYRGKPTFIDFSISENVGRRFISTKDGIHIEDAGIPENYEELATKFMPDYIWPIKDFVKFFGRRELKEFITNLYNAYPLKKDKTSLEQFIRRLSENTIIDYY